MATATTSGFSVFLKTFLVVVFVMTFLAPGACFY
tara:strand:- start:10895 stop:10996 length:102 start_codon:yes stop_codon:yes gene_type:complete